MAKDIDLLVKNAKTYNEPGSQVFKVRVHLKAWCRLLLVSKTNLWLAVVLQDANTIKKIFAQKKSEIEHGEPIKSSIRIRYLTPGIM